MFIKLSFNSDTRITVPLRILADIINTPAVTSVSALQSRFTSASYSTTLTSAFDASNSLILRTVDPTNTKAQVSFWDYVSRGDINFTLEQPVYDDSSSKVYSQLKTYMASSNSQTLYFDIGTAITGGTMASSGVALTVSETLGTTSGTNLVLGGNNLGQGLTCASSGNGFSNVRTFWAYITDKCFFWAVTNGTSYNSGFGSTYADPTKFGGPFFQTQYTRYDYHNTSANGIYPVMYTNQRGTGMGYGTSNDLTTVQNLLYTSSTTVPVRVQSMISALPQVGTSWPKIYNSQVHMTMAGRTSSNYGLNQVQAQGTTSSPTTATYAGAISTASSTRYPNPSLSGTGFGIMPFGWEANYYGNHGGNASEQSGVYIFNGDYVPGDTFIYNNKMYMVWPMYNGFSQRVGFAVPME
jgi:hypothetical protein